MRFILALSASLIFAMPFPALAAAGEKDKILIAICTQQGVLSLPYQIKLWKKDGAKPMYLASAQVVRVGSSTAEELSLVKTLLRSQFTVIGSSVELTVKITPSSKLNSDPYYAATLSLVDPNGNYDVFGMGMACYETEDGLIPEMLRDLEQN